MNNFHQIVTEEYFTKLEQTFRKCKDDEELFKTIVNAPFGNKKITTLLSLGITVLLLVNKKDGTIDRIALSDTEMAKGTVNYSVKPFKEIKIPVDYMDNYIAQAIKTGEHRITSDWKYMFIPALTPQEARFNQAGGGIGCSAMYPLKGARDGGAMIFSYYQTPDKITKDHHAFMKRYTETVAKVLGS